MLTATGPTFTDGPRELDNVDSWLLGRFTAVTVPDGWEAQIAVTRTDVELRLSRAVTRNLHDDDPRANRVTITVDVDIDGDATAAEVHAAMLGAVWSVDPHGAEVWRWRDTSYESLAAALAAIDADWEA